MVPPPLPLTRRQTDALRAVENHIQTYGWAPTYAELADLIGAASTTSAVRLIEHLESKGWVDVEPGTARGIRVIHRLEPESGAAGGTTGAAGKAEEVETTGTREGDSEGPRRVGDGGGRGDGSGGGRSGELGWGRVVPSDEVWIPRSMAPDNRDLYLTRVPDNGMVSCGILIGDLVVWYVVPVPAIQTGDLVVCPVHDRRTVRRARCVGDDILLIPDDALYATARYDAAAGPLGVPMTLQRAWPTDITFPR